MQELVTLGCSLLHGTHTWRSDFIGALRNVEGGVSMPQEVTNCLLFILVAGFLSLLILQLLNTLPTQG
jgi:hypothetical protein